MQMCSNFSIAKGNRQSRFWYHAPAPYKHKTKCSIQVNRFRASLNITKLYKLRSMSKQFYGIMYVKHVLAPQNEFGIQKILGQFTKFLGIEKTSPIIGKNYPQ